MMMMQYMLLALTGLLAVHAGSPPPGPRGMPHPAKTYPRPVTKILTVPNGSTQGGWKREEFCPYGTYASGFELKVENGQGRGDDTALNGVSLKCKSPDNDHYQGKIESGLGQWGDWTKMKECMTLRSTGFYLTSFQLRVERSQGGGDDTAANNIKFKCRPLKSNSAYVIQGDSQRWGDYGAWSASCPMRSAICGIQTRVENHQCNGDDTALNDVKFFCCQIPQQNPYDRDDCPGCSGREGPRGEH